jgi:DNA-binding MarR family transcriptional regulator
MPRPPKQKNDDGLDLTPLTRLIGFHLRDAQIAVFRDFAAAVEGLDASPVIFAVLALIGANQGIKQSALAHSVRLDRSSMVSVLDNLERRKLVERRAVEGDRRSNALALTPAGAALLRTLRRRVASHEQRLARDLSAAERAKLVELLQRIFAEYR